ncbi:hypothetical protein C6Y11_15265 [Lactiplantibacillus pentosus]|nr:hypothetical protein [Lactiplantibacillus pentosus]MCT3283689.1 hypothetical protein [Lactiplantibacillus pentosus]MCT3301475.1 hypothetical protein [Lactiplantibacillus pentosus]PRO76443.1 hypothetical protein C6Y11_15265 [Lactiplantibacillus pentosus]PRO79462.1 hypothetical protein C6Y09_09785 [Lactiplantibacillus pentosus]
MYTGVILNNLEKIQSWKAIPRVYTGVILQSPLKLVCLMAIPRVYGGDPISKAKGGGYDFLFPVYTGVILLNALLGLDKFSFSRINGSDS